MLDQGLEVVPVINKIDLPSADPDRVIHEIEEVLALPASDACLVSAKQNIGIDELMEAIVGQIPPPKGDLNKPLRAFHTDAVQAYGHIPVNVNECMIDMLSMSAHKLRGPKGIGFLYIRNGLELPPYIDGGSQENGRRAGTSNVPGIVGLGKACEIASRSMPRNMNNMTRLRNRIIYKIKQKLPDAVLTGPEQQRLPNNISFCFPNVESAKLLAMLDMQGICASAGSACSTGAAGPSHVLIAMGISPDLASVFPYLPTPPSRKPISSPKPWSRQ